MCAPPRTGIIRNCCNGPPVSPNPFPIYYPRTEATVDQDDWEWSDWVPDAIVVNLGEIPFKMGACQAQPVRPPSLSIT